MFHISTTFLYISLKTLLLGFISNLLSLTYFLHPPTFFLHPPTFHIFIPNSKLTVQYIYTAFKFSVSLISSTSPLQFFLLKFYVSVFVPALNFLLFSHSPLRFKWQLSTAYILCSTFFLFRLLSFISGVYLPLFRVPFYCNL